MKVTDAYNDGNRQIFYRITKLVEMPSFVKGAAITDPNDVPKLPNAVFADPVRRKFPLHTKTATWLSQLYFLENRHKYATPEAARVQEKIANAAKYFGIAGDTKTAATAWETHQETAPEDRSDADYAMVVKHGDQTIKRFPINNPTNVKAAAAHLYGNRMHYPYEWRHIAARKILHKAAELEVQNIESELHEYLIKAAGFGSTAPALAKEKLGQRFLMLPDQDQEMRVRVAKFAKAIGAMNGIPTPAEMIKLAKIIDRLDREYGFCQFYDQGVETPEEMLFTLTEKKAQLYRNGHFQLATGTYVPFAALSNVELNKVAQTIGDDFRKAVMADDSLDVDLEKFGKIAATLPRNDALILERALQSAGALDQQTMPSLEEVAS
ncbi:hypothetical protein LCGC14_0812690 [marine sediment metagenome]|uniref:Uncharacterized protein n=1 Tax=marine sediment metagenome TaxID=412755 RepID=A0A0F9PL70_9ZZZZ